MMVVAPRGTDGNATAETDNESGVGAAARRGCGGGGGYGCSVAGEIGWNRINFAPIFFYACSTFIYI